MKARFTAIGLIVVALASLGLTPSQASGKYKWWATSATSGWFRNGIMCFTKGKTVIPGQKFTFSYKLGQAKSFVNLGSGVSISGDTQVDDQGNVTGVAPTPSDSSASDGTDNSNSFSACTDEASSVAYISPHTPRQGGAYDIKLTVKNKNGSIAWTDDELVLATYTGVASGTNFFTSPPNIYFTADTYAYLSPSNGVIGYTSTGSPRNACLLIYDIAVKAGRTDAPISASDLISSAQQGFFGANVRSIIGNGAIPTAIKCAPWVATYLW